MNAALIFIAVVGLISALATNIFNQSNVADTNATNTQNVQDTNEAQSQLAERQHQWNIEDWQRQNEYDKPINQVARFEEAGLNKSLMYGQLSNSPNSIAPTSLPSLTPPQVMPFQADNPAGQLSSDLLSIAQADAIRQKLPKELNLVDAQVNNLNASAKEHENAAKKLGLEYQEAAATYNERLQAASAEFKARIAQGNLNEAQALEKFKYVQESAKAEYDLLRNEADRVLAEKERILEQTNLTIAERKKVGEEIENLKKERQLMDKQMSQVDSYIESLNAGTANTKQQTKLLRKQNKTYYVDKFFDYFGSITQGLSSMTKAVTLAASGF